MCVLKAAEVSFDKSIHGAVHAAVYVVKDILVVRRERRWSWRVIYRWAIFYRR